MKQCFAVLAAVGVVCVIGCPHNLYEVQMTPQGQRVERSVSSQRVGEPPAATQPDGQPAQPQVTVVRGVLDGLMPDAVGGASGRYQHVATSLGGVTAYLERFRGNDDQSGVVERQFQAVDRVVDILLGWAKAERGDRAEFAKLGTFLDVELRRDLKNLALHMWMFSAANRQVGPDGRTCLEFFRWETVARATQYLIERGYLVPEDLTLIARWQEAEGQAEQLALLRPLVRRLLTAKVGLTDKQVIDDLASLLDKPEEVETSLTEYLAGVEAYKEHLAEWNRQAATQPQDQRQPEPDPIEWLAEQLAAMFHLDMDIADADDEVKIVLKTGTEPLATNGQWDAQARQVAWSCRIAPESAERTHLPVICYAVWAQPDEVFQKARFGRVAVDGEDLALYALWHKGLTDAQARQWDQFLASLKPGDELPGKLEAFRFAGQDDRDEPVLAAGSIIKRLKKEEPSDAPDGPGE